MKNYNRYQYQIPINASILAISVLVTLIVQRHEQQIGGGIGRPLLFLLINVEIFIAILLLASIIRQSVMLFLERRKQRPGSVFKKNLLFAFIFLSILPGIFIFFGASRLVIKHLELWFGTRIEQGLSSGMAAYEETTQNIREELRETGENTVSLYTTSKQLPVKMNGFEVYRWPLFNDRSIHLPSEITQWRDFREINDRSTAQLKREFTQKIYDSAENSEVLLDFFGSTYWLKVLPTEIIAVVYRPPEPLRSTLIKIHNAYSDYTSIREIKRLLNFNFYLQSALLLFIIFVLAIWCAFHLARSISEPLQGLLEATHAIRHGNLGVRVPTDTSGDLKTLGESFNDMTQALNKAHHALAKKNEELLAIFGHLSASVFLCNRWGRIVMANNAAENLCTLLAQKPTPLGKKFTKLPETLAPVIRELLQELSAVPYAKREYHCVASQQPLILMIHTHRLEMPSSTLFLFIIEDLSNIVKVNKLKTWQEAAKQIAHEIKNPLTPINLATQRLQRQCSSGLDTHTQTILNESCSMILEQVGVIKNLVNNFSSFAVQTPPHLKPCAMFTLLEQTLKIFRMSYPQIAINLIEKKQSNLIDLDDEKMKRVFVNLISNSITALEKGESITQPIISITLDPLETGINIIIADNGPGIAPEVIDRLFLPYISTDRKSMGLGLAIVHEIIALHGGTIHVKPSEKGACFSLFLPYQQSLTHAAKKQTPSPPGE